MFQPSPDFLSYLHSGPATIIVAPDAPVFSILYANPAYCQATLSSPGDIVGRGFMEAFPESPDDPEGDNVEVLRASLIECVRTKKRVELPGKRYDVPVRGTDQFETKYWQASNNPVLDAHGEILYIAHVTVEITGAFELARKERIAREVTAIKNRDLHALLMDAPAAIAMLNGPDLVFEFENTSHQQLFCERKLAGKAFLEAFPEYKGSRLFTALKEVYEQGKSYEQKEVLIGPAHSEEYTSHEQYWNFIWQPRYTSGNQIDGIIVFGYQVSDQVVGRKKVEDSEKQLQTILETMAEGLGIVDRQGNMVYANPMAERLLGIRKEEILNRTYFDPKWRNLRIDGSPLPAEEHPVFQSMVQAEAVYDCEIGVQPPEGERFFVSINAAPLKDENGEVTGAIGTFMDVTQRRKAAEMKDEFISTVSHELKTPLTSVKAYLQMLDRSLNGSVDSKSRRYLDRLGVQVSRLETLVRDFLDVTRIDTGKFNLRMSAFDMESLLKDLVNDLQPVTPSHHLRILASEPVQVISDPNRVIQVLSNLITNAVKYSPDADQVLIALKKDKGEMICSVRDFGIGISVDQQEVIFDRFHQVVGNKGSGLSLGLGLYISREIAERAGGRIWLESAEGGGSVFYLSLPLPEN